MTKRKKKKKTEVEEKKGEMGLSSERLAEIRQRERRATPGPWYWREGVHTTDPKTSDAGGFPAATQKNGEMP